MGRFERFRSRIDDRAVVVVLVVVYLSIMATLALTADRRFFFNDLLALAAWVVIGLVLYAQGFLRGRR